MSMSVLPLAVDVVTGPDLVLFSFGRTQMDPETGGDVGDPADGSCPFPGAVENGPSLNRSLVAGGRVW